MNRELHSSRSDLRSNRKSAVRPHSAVAIPAQVRRLSARMDQMQGELDHIKRARESLGTSRQGVHEQIEKNGADLGVQFQRIAMMQAEIDRLKSNETMLQAEIDHLEGRRRQPLVGTNHAEGTPSKV